MILGIAAIQGFVLATILFLNKRGNKLCNALLTALLCVFSLILVEEFLESYDLNDVYPKITGATFLFDMLLGPLTYLYATLITKNDFKWARSYRNHLVIPILLNVIYLVYHVLAAWDVHLINNASLNVLFVGLIIAKILYQLTYQIISIRNLTLFVKREQERSEKAQFKVALWLRNVLSLSMIMVASVLVFQALPNTPSLDSDLITSLIMIFAIYSMGYMALANPIVYTRTTDVSGFEKKLFSTAGAAKYNTSSLSEKSKQVAVDALTKAMESDQLFLNPELTSISLAEALGLNRHHLSQILNEVFSQNFYDFVNAYRVIEVKRRIEEADHLRLNVLAIGLESGFNSKATFNRAFKKATGQTPQGYIKSLRIA